MEDVFPELLYSDSSCSQACRRHCQACCWRSQACCPRFQASHRRPQACLWLSQTCCRRSLTCLRCSQVLPGAPKVLSGAPRCSQTYHNHCHGTPEPVIRDPSYSEGRPECPPGVWYSPEIDVSKYTLHILSDTPAGFQWLKYILLMFESPETDLHIPENAGSIDYVDTWSPKRVHWLSKSECPHCSTSDYGCEDTLELYTGVTRAYLLITGIHTGVAPKSTIHWLPATFHNSGWMDDCEVSHGSIEAISILDPVDVKEAYSHIASRYRSVQWHVWWHGWHDASFGEEEDSMEGRLVLRCEVSSTEAVQILCWSDSNDRHASHFCTYPPSFPEVAIV